VTETGSVSCPIAEFGIICVTPYGYVTSESHFVSFSYGRGMKCEQNFNFIGKPVSEPFIEGRGEIQKNYGIILKHTLGM